MGLLVSESQRQRAFNAAELPPVDNTRAVELTLSANQAAGTSASGGSFGDTVILWDELASLEPSPDPLQITGEDITEWLKYDPDTGIFRPQRDTLYDISFSLEWSTTSSQVEAAIAYISERLASTGFHDIASPTAPDEDDRYVVGYENAGVRTSVNHPTRTRHYVVGDAFRIKFARKSGEPSVDWTIGKQSWLNIALR